MKYIIRFALLTLVLLVVSHALLLPRQAQAQPNDSIPGRMLVKFRKNSAWGDIIRQTSDNQAVVQTVINQINVLVLTVPEPIRERMLERLSRNPYVEFAEPDFYATALSVPNDTFFDRQWALENTGQTVNGITGTVDADIDAPESWDTTPGGVPVAILDCGINESHPELTGKVSDRRDFTGSSSGTNDIYGHGTHVAGIVSASTDNGTGVAGVCPSCMLLNGKVLDDNGSGAYSWIANGIIWATDNGAKVINLSLGGSVSSTTLENAVNYAWNKGVIVVAAAGNSNNSSKTYPAAYINAIAVAATDNKDAKAYFSSYGSRWVDIAAPGVDIFSTWKNSSSSHSPQPECYDTVCYKYASGTSMSTPVVAGVAGLVWMSDYNQSASAVRTRIESTADNIAGTGTYWSAGRVNAASAVAGSAPPAPTPTNTPTLIHTPTPTPTQTPTPTPTYAPPEDTESPTITITSPIDGSFVSRGKRITIRANASDNVKMKKVEFYINNSLLSTDTTSPYTTTWRVPYTANVTYTIKAVAYDTSNNSGTSTISVTSR